MVRAPEPREVSISHEHNRCGAPTEHLLDITSPSGQPEFLGLLDGLDRSGNRLTSLFEWTCAACGTTNQNAAAVEPYQSFLAEWS